MAQIAFKGEVAATAVPFDGGVVASTLPREHLATGSVLKQPKLPGQLG